jgi:hypothetical protein
VSITLFSCDGGDVIVPDRSLILVSRADGGNLIVTPSRQVWERSELSRVELMMWSALVAAAGRAMLDELPQLKDGCINYWEAGNWALNDAAEPRGPKAAGAHRKVHLHLLGRSRTATDASWRWGEAPNFPSFENRHEWAAPFERLAATECQAIVERLVEILKDKYEFEDEQIRPWAPCSTCEYPMAAVSRA